MTPREIAEKACLSARTVRALLDAKVVPSVERDGERYVRWEDFERFLATCPVSEWLTKGGAPC